MTKEKTRIEKAISYIMIVLRQLSHEAINNPKARKAMMKISEAIDILSEE